MARELLLDTYGTTAAIPGMDKKLARNPSLWRTVSADDPTDLFSVIADVYKSTGKVYTRPATSSTEAHAYIAVHVAEKCTKDSMNAVLESSEFNAIINSKEMNQARRVFETQVLARKYMYLDGFPQRRRK